MRSDETAAFLFTGNPSRKKDPCRPFWAHVKIYRIAGFFRGGIFSRIHTATIFSVSVEISKFSQVKFSRIELDSRNS